MPELPEVETVRRTLLPVICGRVVCEVHFFWERVAANTPAALLREHLVGGCLTDINRRGKYLIFTVADRGFLVVHLRMTGRLMALPTNTTYEDKHLRALLALSGGISLRFVDQRKFGRFYWAENEDALTSIVKVGQEPLADGFTPKTLADTIGRSSVPIKALLLDQRRIAGLGNIYADESLFCAGILPQRPANSLTASEISCLCQAIRSTLTDALQNHGTTFRDYVDGRGEPGENQHHLLVYGRAGQPCKKCGNTLLKMRLAGRGTVYCAHCQQ